MNRQQRADYMREFLHKHEVELISEEDIFYMFKHYKQDFEQGNITRNDKIILMGLYELFLWREASSTSKLMDFARLLRSSLSTGFTYPPRIAAGDGEAVSTANHQENTDPDYAAPV